MVTEWLRFLGLMEELVLFFGDETSSSICLMLKSILTSALDEFRDCDHLMGDHLDVVAVI